MTGAPKETGASMLEGEGEDPMAAAGGKGNARRRRAVGAGRGRPQPAVDSREGSGASGGGAQQQKGGEPAGGATASGGEAPPQAAAQKKGRSAAPPGAEDLRDRGVRGVRRARRQVEQEVRRRHGEAVALLPCWRTMSRTLYILLTRVIHIQCMGQMGQEAYMGQK